MWVALQILIQEETGVEGAGVGVWRQGLWSWEEGPVVHSRWAWPKGPQSHAQQTWSQGTKLRPQAGLSATWVSMSSCGPPHQPLPLMTNPLDEGSRVTVLLAGTRAPSAAPPTLDKAVGLGRDRFRLHSTGAAGAGLFREGWSLDGAALLWHQP